MTLTIEDVERLQQRLQEDEQDFQIELQEGNILVMGPSDIESSEIGAQLIFLLKLWVNPRKLGRIFDSSGGFIMPNTDLRAPDVSFVAAQRLKRTVRDFGQLVPDLVVEIKSKTDRISKLEDKVKLFLELGARVGILINPDELNVSVYRPNGDIEVLRGDDKLTIAELFPGWEVAISEIWPPVFE
jgi:Uma2 family endonuclease